MIDQKCTILRKQIGEESKQRFENVDILEQALQQDVPVLQEKVSTIKVLRDEHDQQLHVSIDAKTSEVVKLIKSEKLVREEN